MKLKMYIEIFPIEWVNNVAALEKDIWLSFYKTVTFSQTA